MIVISAPRYLKPLRALLALALCATFFLQLGIFSGEDAEAATLQRGDVSRASSGGIVLDAELHTKQPVFDKHVSVSSVANSSTPDTIHTYSYTLNVPAKTYTTLGTTVSARWSDVGFDAEDDRIDLVVSWLPDSRWYSLSALSQIPLLQRYDKNGYGTAGICIGINKEVTGARACCEQHLKIEFFKHGTSTPARGSFLTKITDLDKAGWYDGYDDRWCESIEFVSGHGSDMYVSASNVLNIGMNRNNEDATDYRATREMDGSSLDSGVVACLSSGSEFWYYSTHGWTDILDQFDPKSITLWGTTGGEVHCDGKTGTIPVGWRGSRTVSIDASVGYKITDVRIDGGSVGTPSSYTFTSVTDHHTLDASFAPIAYTITFKPNDAEGLMPSLTLAYDESRRLTNNSFVRPGYLFTGWSTHSDGSGTHYEDAQEVRNLSSADGTEIVLYAQWKPIEYEVAFDANSGVGSMPNQSFFYDRTRALTPNSFTKTGYSFDGWNTRQDGSGEAFADGQEVVNLTSNQDDTVTLYAQWTPITYRVTFDANEGKGAMEEQRFIFDQTDRLYVNQFSRTGYLFTGWNTQADGKGVRYTDLQEILNLSSTFDDVIELYAQWVPIGYYIVFDAQGGSGTMADQMLLYDQAEALQQNTLQRTGYRWVAWNAHPSLPEESYADCEVVKNLAERANETVVLYAIWTANRCLIVYDSNGGTGSMHAQSLAYGTAETLYPNKFERIGYRWSSWNTQPDGSGLSYDNEQCVQDLSTIDNSIITLYAQWAEKPEGDEGNSSSPEPDTEDPDPNPEPDQDTIEQPGDRPSEDGSSSDDPTNNPTNAPSSTEKNEGNNRPGADLAEMADPEPPDEPGESEEDLASAQATRDTTSKTTTNSLSYAKTGEAIVPIVCCALAGATLGAVLMIYAHRKKKCALEKQRRLFQKYLKP